MIDDVELNKAAIIRRCLTRIREEFRDDRLRLDGFTIQDAIILNLLRACEAAIDLAMHCVAASGLGVPRLQLADRRAGSVAAALRAAFSCASIA